MDLRYRDGLWIYYELFTNIIFLTTVLSYEFLTPLFYVSFEESFHFSTSFMIT